jgi:LacI family transcriptional regulator, galactose operon repressor
MSRKRITIKDIARILDLAPSTVSRSLADHPDISHETKRKVREAAQALNYVPNYRARYLRAKYSRLIALITPEMNMFFIPSLISGINRVVQRTDYSLIVFQSDDSVIQERKLMQDCLNLSVDGVLLALSSETSDLKHLRPLLEAGIPTVLLDKVIETDEHSTVTIDGLTASRQAVSYLIDQGHRRILGIFSDSRQRISVVREKGFCRAFEDAGLPVDEELILHHPLLSGFDTRTLTVLDQHPDITAAFVMSDELLVRMHYLCLKTGRSIPDDLSIVAISDGYTPHFLFPKVTHIRHSGLEIGEKAAQILAGMIQQESNTTVDAKVKVDLVKLGSVSSISAAAAL